MRKCIFIITIILAILITAVAIAAINTKAEETIRASAFAYDASMPVIHSKHFIYDPTAATIRGAAFVN